MLQIVAVDNAWCLTVPDLNHLLGVGALCWINGGSIDIKILLSQYGGATIDRLATAIEDATHHVLRHGCLQHL
jgi:hypothetical protein